MGTHDPWVACKDALDCIRTLTDKGMTIPDIRSHLGRKRIPAPPTAAGSPQKWSDDLVAAGRAYLSRRAAAAPPPPPPPPEVDDVRAQVEAAVTRYAVQIASMSPTEWEAWQRSAEGRATVRHINTLTCVMQVSAALRDGATASAPKLAEVLARLTDSMEAGAEEQLGVAEDVRTVEDAAMAVLDYLPTIRDLVGRDAILRAIGLRERHVEAAP